MAQIVINEISQNYTYNIGTHSYATVAMPITSSWGPGFFDPETYYGSDTIGKCEDPIDYMLEHTAWKRFPATQQGLESFVSTYRGPAAPYRRAKDFSYQMAMTLLTAGYDVLVCRLSPGCRAEGSFKQKDSDGIITFKAKYPGTFGNNIQVTFKKNIYFDGATRTKRIYWSVITHIVDVSGVKTSVENIPVVFNVDNSTDNIYYYTEVDSAFWDISLEGTINEDLESANVPEPNEPDALSTTISIRLKGGSDTQATGKTREDIKKIAEIRYKWADIYNDGAEELYNNYSMYPNVFLSDGTNIRDDELDTLYYKEWLYTSLVGYPVNTTEDFIDPDNKLVNYEGVFDLLKDKLAYNPQRVISSGWDDQDYTQFFDNSAEITNYMFTGLPIDPETGEVTCPDTCLAPISPIHLKLMEVGYYSRCATALIDIPKIVDRKYVHIEDEYNLNREGYAQKLARVVPYNAALDVNGSLFHTHSALFAPWGQYTFVGTGKMNTACPSFLALMIQRAQILNQPIQYEWALPTNRKHNLRIGKLDYTVPKKILDKWQKLEGASVNVITTIPDLGINLWGNSTLYEVPPSTYQALANLSTRYLVNAVEDCAYKCGIGITFQYNNDQAYNKFYAGVTPLLDTMKNVGAIEDYYVKMAADINGLDQVNANTVIGKIYLVVNGVINDIIVDLIALPPGVDLDQYRS